MSPPGKYGSPVIAVSVSAAALENVECPEIYPAKGGVTKLDLWYGHQFSARIQSVPAESMLGSLIYLGHFQALSFIFPLLTPFFPSSVSPVPMSSIYPGMRSSPIGE